MFCGAPLHVRPQHTVTSNYTVSPKNCHLKLSVPFSKILTDFESRCTAGKRMKFATKAIQNCPSHLRHVATLPWEIKNSYFLHMFSKYGRKWKRIAFLSPLTLLFIHKFWYFRCLNSAFSPYWLQIKLFMSLFFYLFIFAINLWNWKFVTADVTAVFVNNQHSIRRRGQDFDKNT